jgi:hypothetical protein
MADSRVNLVAAKDGIEKTWFAADNNSVGAHAGWIDPLVTARVDSMIKSGSSGEAQRVVDEIATIGAVERINASFHDELKSAVASVTYKIRFSDGATGQPLFSPRAPDDTVMMNVTYLLSDDATVLS